MAQHSSRNTTGADDSSASSRERSCGWAGSTAADGSSGAWASVLKMTDAAPGDVSNKPFCMLQMNTASAITESTKALSSIETVVMAGPLAGVMRLEDQPRRGWPAATSMAGKVAVRGGPPGVR
jgi:hypothetical protein